MASICKSGGKECVDCGECFYCSEDDVLGSCAICGRLLTEKEGFFYQYFHFICRTCYENVSSLIDAKGVSNEKKGKNLNGENRNYRYE